MGSERPKMCVGQGHAIQDGIRGAGFGLHHRGRCVRVHEASGHRSFASAIASWRTRGTAALASAKAAVLGPIGLGHRDCGRRPGVRGARSAALPTLERARCAFGRSGRAAPSRQAEEQVTNPETYSIQLRVQRIVREDAFISVPVTAIEVLQHPLQTPLPDGRRVFAGPFPTSDEPGRRG